MADRPRILLVAHQGRKAFENRLKRRGWQVDVAATEAAAEDRLGRTSSPPDVVVTDFGAPGGSMGAGLTRWLRRQEHIANLPVLAVSLQDTDEAFLEALRAGAGDWLAMPFSAADGAAKIDALCDARQPMMADRLGQDDPVALRRISLADEDDVSDEALGQRLAAAGAALDERLLAALPDDMAAGFRDNSPGLGDVDALEELHREAAAGGRLKEIVCSYDFKHPARFNKMQMRAMESLHEEYAQRLAGVYSHHMRAPVTADVAFMDQTTYAEFVASLSNPNVAYQFQASSMGVGEVVMDVAMPLVFALVDRCHGGKGSPEPQGVPRQVSQIEMGVLARFARGALEHLEDTWSAVLGPTVIHDIMLETNPEFLQITTKAEIVLLIGIEVNSLNASGLMLLCYPFFTLESVLSHLDSDRISYSSRMRRTEDPRPENRLRLGGMRVPAVVEVGRTQMPAAQACTLEAGDVIRLDARAEDPALVFVGGRAKFRGWPAQDDTGQLGLQVAGRVPPQWEAKLGGVDGALPGP